MFQITLLSQVSPHLTIFPKQIGHTKKIKSSFHSNNILKNINSQFKQHKIPNRKQNSTEYSRYAITVSIPSAWNLQEQREEQGCCSEQYERSDSNERTDEEQGYTNSSLPLSAQGRKWGCCFKRKNRQFEDGHRQM